MILNCIAIDDEPLALGLVKSFIEKTPFLKLVGAYSSAVEALKVLDDLQFHLVFLDIHMPELNGMEFSRLLAESKNKQGRIIFTTAFNQFAIEGYQVDALFYLLKPFNYNEFLQAVNKGLHYFESLDEQPAMKERAREKYLFVKSDYKLIRIDLDRIVYIESIKDYIKIHVKDAEQPIVSLSTLKAVEEKLPVHEFLRIHRSFIVGIDKIDAIGRNSLHIGGTEIPVGDLYKEQFKRLIEKWG
jgi:two-component system, LytTR family, response regulator LytT